MTEPATDTTRLLGHPFYDRDSEAAPWRGLLPPYDVEPDDEPDDQPTCQHGYTACPECFPGRFGGARKTPEVPHA